MPDWEDVILGGGVALGVLLGYKYREDLKREIDRLMRRVNTLETKRERKEKEEEATVI